MLMHRMHGAVPEDCSPAVCGVLGAAAVRNMHRGAAAPVPPSVRRPDDKAHVEFRWCLTLTLLLVPAQARPR